ncbi:SbmA/BacA-like family transporter [Methylocystis heyeri]|uniref:SbmA/BacA-like family transporter n=1 Tax=Methylocystis heyeri TaxID=391905 RepID=UPI00113E75D8
MIHRFILLAFGFWRGRLRAKAWTLSIGFLACLIFNTLVALAVNRWSKSFFDALQTREPDGIIQCIVQLAVLGAVTAVAAIATLQCRMRLQIGWRLWLTANLVERWLQRGPSREQAISHSLDNPEARIADDGRQAVELFVDLAGGVINIFLVSISFIVVLWQVGGSFEIFGVTVPGFLVIAVVLYTVMTSLGMWILGRPLVMSVEDKAAAEGHFRYALTKVRDDLEKSDDSRDQLGPPPDFRGRLACLAKQWAFVIKGQTRIVFLTSANGLFAPAVPLLLGAPKYLAGDLTLGDLMQAAAAFVQVQLSLNWLADNALSIANWSASARRVAALDLAIENREAVAQDEAIIAFPKDMMATASDRMRDAPSARSRTA